MNFEALIAFSILVYMCFAIFVMSYGFDFGNPHFKINEELIFLRNKIFLLVFSLQEYLFAISQLVLFS